jgi:hypothetical protein
VEGVGMLDRLKEVASDRVSDGDRRSRTGVDHGIKIILVVLERKLIQRLLRIASTMSSEAECDAFKTYGTEVFQKMFLPTPRPTIGSMQE